MTNILKAILALLTAILDRWWGKQAEAQEAQQEIVEESNETIESIPDMSDAELAATAESTGLLSKGPGRPGKLGGSYFNGGGCKTPPKADRESE